MQVVARSEGKSWIFNRLSQLVRYVLTVGCCCKKSSILLRSITFPLESFAIRAAMPFPPCRFVLSPVGSTRIRGIRRVAGFIDNAFSHFTNTKQKPFRNPNCLLIRNSFECTDMTPANRHFCIALVKEMKFNRKTPFVRHDFLDLTSLNVCAFSSFNLDIHTLM